MPTGCPGGFGRLLLGVGVPAESSLELTHKLFCQVRIQTGGKPGSRPDVVLPEGVYML